ncbi:endonuclease domain-containing 1 protein-like [Paramormyrops kingsleyae]|uniref:endonuclease domain-containing 1 protein-like n=1 Tax=Paramormyrops kingsleyae TaxID=1676925 RepID=UPI003B977FF0
MKLHEALLLLLLPLSACWAEVVEDFTQRCPGFFATPNDVVSPPTRFNGDRYKQICQTQNGERFFATFYDTANRIPVYSAYKFNGLGNCQKCRKSGKWFIEPQLDEPVPENIDMAKESTVRSENRGHNQALHKDYKKRGYDRGHLAPVCHQNLPRCVLATFTLTNAAPQLPEFNKDWYHNVEKKVSEILSSTCIPSNLRAYVVTGVVPGREEINNRVRIPSHFWTAFCCLDNNNRAIRSSAFLAEYQQETWPQMSVQDLERRLTTLYNNLNTNIPFTLFGGGCYTVQNIQETKGKRRKYSFEQKSEKRRKSIKTV